MQPQRCSLRWPRAEAPRHGESGTIVDVKIFTRENGDELGPGVNQVVRVCICRINQETDFFTLEFNAADTMVAGRTNCNRFFGRYELKGKKLEFENMGMTRMACPDMQYEDAFVKMLDDVDDMLESFIGKDIMEEPLEQYDKLLSPAVHFDFKNITFSFLPHQVKDMDALVKNLESSAPEIIGVAPYEQCKQFIEALARYQKFSDIRNVGAAIHSMIESVTEKMDEVGFKDDEEWTYLTKIFGSNAIPAESAATITKAIKKAEKDGAITSKNRWQLIEMLATEYLAGK